MTQARDTAELIDLFERLVRDGPGKPVELGEALRCVAEIVAKADRQKRVPDAVLAAAAPAGNA